MEKLIQSIAIFIALLISHSLPKDFFKSDLFFLLVEIVGVFIIIFLIKPLRILIFSLAAIASFFACVASIIHFQILPAVGFFF
ncbi:MAG: hypothetical protein ABGX26_05960 [Nautiliaceae bacterium]